MVRPSLQAKLSPLSRPMVVAPPRMRPSGVPLRFMRALIRTLVVALIACVVGMGVATYFLRFRTSTVPDPPVVVEKMREVAKLETLQVTSYKIMVFKPDPKVTGSLARDFIASAKDLVAPSEGKAVVFADLYAGLDLEHLTPDKLRVRGDSIEVVLPPVTTRVELRPADTLVVASNLDSQETMQLLDNAKVRFETELGRNPELRERARQANERAIRALLITLGFREIVFVPSMSATVAPG